MLAHLMPCQDGWFGGSLSCGLVVTTSHVPIPPLHSGLSSRPLTSASRRQTPVPRLDDVRPVSIHAAGGGAKIIEPLSIACPSGTVNPL